MRFAAEVEPDNESVKTTIDLVKQQLDLSSPSIPSAIGLEKQINPFMRLRESAVRAYCGVSADTSDAETMRVLRERKDAFVAPKEKTNVHRVVEPTSEGTRFI